MANDADLPGQPNTLQMAGVGHCSTLQIEPPCNRQSCLLPSTVASWQTMWHKLGHHSILLLQSDELPQGGNPWRKVKSTCQSAMLASEAAVNTSKATATLQSSAAYTT